MQSQSRLLDDLARVASGALGVAAGMRGEVEARLREQFERVIQQMDLVTREDYEVVHAMAQKAREEQEAMAERLEKLEARLAELESAKPAAKPKAAPAKSGTRKGGSKPSGSGKTTGKSGATGQAGDGGGQA